MFEILFEINYTTFQRFGDSKIIFKEINIIQQGSVILIRSDSKDIYNDAKYLFFK